MKNALLTLILTFGILSCNAQSQREKEEKIRSEINAEFDKNSSNCTNGIDAVSDFNDKTEFWNICELKNGNRIIRIDSHKKDTYYQEIYFEKNGDLIYAKETENYMPKNHFTQMSWNCEFYAENGKLIALMSLGHGKTEDEEWNPDVIFEMYKNRLTELKRIKKITVYNNGYSSLRRNSSVEPFRNETIAKTVVANLKNTRIKNEISSFRN